MSVQRSEMYHFSAVDVFLELLKRRICYYTKKVQQSDGCDMSVNEKFSLRLIRSKLRKREESSGVHRTNVVHPEGVLQANVNVAVVSGTEMSTDLRKLSILEDIFITPTSNRTSMTCSHSGTSLSSYSLESSYSQPMFLYSTGNSRDSLNCNDQVSFHFLLVGDKEVRLCERRRLRRRKKRRRTYLIKVPSGASPHVLKLKG